MRVRTVALVVCLSVVATSFLMVPRSTALSPSDHEAIRATALDYVEGWYTGDAERMRSALHPDLAKRIVRTDADGVSRLHEMTADQLVDATSRAGRTREDERISDVKILDVFGNTASVRAEMSGWVDYMHIARYDGDWRIVNVLWEMK